MSDITLTVDEVRRLTEAALVACGTAPGNARSVADSVVAAELDGIHSHGLARLPTYCEHARCGKIDGAAVPLVERPAAGAIRVDARDGFAHPAIAAGFALLVPTARDAGIAGMAVTNSYNCGVLGYHVEALAREGLVGLGFTNAPASMAPAGGRVAIFGTNPVACAVPDGRGGAALVIDQSSSVVAKSELIVHASRGEAIPEGWALDGEGNPTSDPAAGLAGTMLPAGGYKGAGIAAIVEIMAAVLGGATLGVDASSFADNEGGSPRTGQFFIAIEPEGFSGGRFGANLDGLLAAIGEQQGARIPGRRRMDNRARYSDSGIAIPGALHQRILGYGGAD